MTGQIPEELGESAKREGERVKRLWAQLSLNKLHLPYKPLGSLRSRRFQSSYGTKAFFCSLPDFLDELARNSKRLLRRLESTLSRDDL